MKAIPILHTDIRGSGPTVVLLHGFLGSSRYWHKVADLVAQDYKVIAFDLLGFGKSPKPRHNAYDYDDHIASINATLEKMQVTEPFILMGHSMGSLIALRYATLYEDRVQKLILTNMPVMLNYQEVNSEILGTSLVYKLGLTPVTHHLVWPVFRALYHLKFLPRRTLTRLMEDKGTLFQHNATSRIRSFRNVIRDGQVGIDLRAVKVKTLVISGLDDRKVYIDNLFRKIQFGPNVVLENVQTGHHIPRVMPEFIRDRLRGQRHR